MNLAEQWNPAYKPSHKRRTPKRAARGKFSPKTIQSITKRDNGLCVRCGSPYIESVPHHVIYKSQMGKGTVDNGATTCRRCHDWAHGKCEGPDGEPAADGRKWFESFARSAFEPNE
jgi:5-methylcytosine-specific restriction endonuclease McrA